MKSEQQFEWGTAATVWLNVKGHGKALALTCMRDRTEWCIIAVESSATDSLRAIFRDHAHAQLPSQPDLRAAIAIAERYAKAWLRDPRTALATCGCGEIGKPTARYRKRSAAAAARARPLRKAPTRRPR